jgi:hypothetical protein
MTVINQTMARQYWPNNDSLGKEVRIPDLKSEPPFSQAMNDANG